MSDGLPVLQFAGAVADGDGVDFGLLAEFFGEAFDGRLDEVVVFLFGHEVDGAAAEAVVSSDTARVVSSAGAPVSSDTLLPPDVPPDAPPEVPPLPPEAPPDAPPSGAAGAAGSCTGTSS